MLGIRGAEGGDDPGDHHDEEEDAGERPGAGGLAHASGPGNSVSIRLPIVSAACASSVSSASGRSTSAARMLARISGRTSSSAARPGSVIATRTTRPSSSERARVTRPRPSSLSTSWVTVGWASASVVASSVIRRGRRRASPRTPASVRESVVGAAPHQQAGEPRGAAEEVGATRSIASERSGDDVGHIGKLCNHRASARLARVGGARRDPGGAAATFPCTPGEHHHARVESSRASMSKK